MTRKLALFIFSLLAIALISGAGCTRSGSTANDDGGQHGGGGHVQRSTPEQVRAAIALALRLATGKNLSVSVFAGLYKTTEYNRPWHVEFVFPNVGNRLSGESKSYNADYVDSDFRSPIIDALNHNKIILKDVGDCGSAKDNHADASVSSFTADADICFSVGNLTRLAPSSLLQEVLSLVLHETVHLGGGSEAEAVAWQNAFSVYFAKRFGSLSPSDALEQTQAAIMRDSELLVTALPMAVTVGKLERIYVIGELHSSLWTTPYLFDPIKLELSLSPAHPELAGNYINAMVALLLETNYFLRDLNADDPSPSTSTSLNPNIGDMALSVYNPTKKLDLLVRLEKMQKIMTVAADNFDAYLKFSSTKKSICILPNSIETQMIYNILPADSILPPITCAPGTSKLDLDEYE